MNLEPVMAAAGVAHRVPLLVHPHPLGSKQNHILLDEKTRNQPREEGQGHRSDDRRDVWLCGRLSGWTKGNANQKPPALGPPFREERGTEEPLAAWVDSLGGHVSRD